MKIRESLPIFARSCAKILPAACLLGASASLLAGDPPPPPTAGANWTLTGGGADESGFSSLTQIDSANVSRLGLAWALTLPGEASLEAQPLAVDGMLYFTGSMGTVYAVDGRTGKLVWSHDPKVYEKAPIKQRVILQVNRGAAYENGRVFAATIDGRLNAFDAKTGKVLWTAVTLDPGNGMTVTGAPRVFRGKVIIGNAGAESNGQGYVTAYDAATGKQLWRFRTVPGTPEQDKGDPAMERAAATWGGEYWKQGRGGTPWNGMTFDPELDRVYIGTGNSSPYNPAVRSPGGGDNLYLDSVVALDASTGKYLWHYQENPREAWDYKSIANIIVATIPVDGKPRRVLLHAPTNGFFYVLDRDTGKLLSAEKYGKVTWADHIDLKTGRPVEAPNIRYETGSVTIWPSPNGAHNWQPMSFNPKTGLVYIPYMHAGLEFRVGEANVGQIGLNGIAMRYLQDDPEDMTGALVAWDPATQKQRWRVPLPKMLNGGTMTTAGNLVFQGTADGWFDAYDATTGKRLWHFDARMGIIAAPITWSLKGRQYVSVLTGYGAAAASMGTKTLAGWRYDAPRNLLTFALDGKAKMPAAPPRYAPVKALDNPAFKVVEADVIPGAQLYTMNCAACHGVNVVGAGGPGPDLRESAIALDFASFRAVLHDGLLRSRGMPQIDDLTDDQIAKIQTFIRVRARETLGLRPAVKYDMPAPNKF